MSPVGDGVLSLTKFYGLRDLGGELARVAPGMTHEQVRGVLGVMHKHLQDDLVLYDSGGAVDDPLLQACRSRSASAPALIWIALVMADRRLAEIVETYLTDRNGKLVEDHFNTDKLETALAGVLPANVGKRKPATNILSYFRDSGLVAPRTYSKTIIGISHTNDTAPYVRDAVRYILFRLQHLQLPYPVGMGDDADVALAVKANHWLDLTPTEWRAAYDGTRPDATPSPPSPPPPPRRTPPPPPVASEVEVEAHNTETYEVSGQTNRTAVRREQPLVIAYKAWMERQGSKVVRHKFRPPNTPAHLFSDIYDKTRNNLIEGKADASRPSVRMAIGQLLDYRRFAPPDAKLAILTDRRPHQDLEDLLGSLEIACIWKTEDGFEDNANGVFV
jgi:hypothetical protein